MMENKILNGKNLADKLNLELKEEINKFVKKTGIKPKLAAILVGEDPASEVYVNIKRKKCAEAGIESILVKLDKEISNEELLNEIDKLNKDKTVHGIILQLPLPNKLRESTNEFIEKIFPLKDVDGSSPINKGMLFDYNEELAACTPKGIIALLEYYNIDLKGKDVVIINRSNLVGKPLIFMLLKRNATVTVCHTSTKNIEEHMRRSDILIVAVGIPNFITQEKIKKGAIIIDVGQSRVEGKLFGDVDFDDVLEKCAAITPTPGGVGPLTVAFLLQNTFIAYKKQIKIY
ncbi:MAG: bifunctional 5,10-methylenetetrahydrofolate dehydrogenase/5,10-methenyltetrahydrofolate cyclohydrolase [Candidatus Lokiarchaeota archaeon]|nr:bifunctional 5,10-methylenetetrahydrofolate dehydrogenase/5,10-methenyltetrahydrofolate cyclohydrolase [Candidatus Lokiarchaeota archaeon]